MVIFISAGLQIYEEGQLDVGGEGAQERVDIWRKYLFGEFG